MVEINAASAVLQDSTDGQPLVVAPLLQNIVGNVIYGIIFGQRCRYKHINMENRNYANTGFKCIIGLTMKAIHERIEASVRKLNRGAA